MNVILNDDKLFELFIETYEDLWILSQVINKDDLIFGKSFRKVKIEQGQNYKITRKEIFVDLKVDKIKFENQVLKFIGFIQNETEFTTKNMSESLSFKIGCKIKFLKNKLFDFEKNMIFKSCNSKKKKNLLIVLDKDNLIACEFSDFNFKILFFEKNLGSNKKLSININDSEQKFLLIEDLLKKDYLNVIFSGPSFFKEDLKKFVEIKMNLKIIIVSFSDVSRNCINKILYKIYDLKILDSIQIGLESFYINQFLKNINLGKKYVYSKKKTFDCVILARCEVLLVSTKFLDKEKENNNFDELNNIFQICENSNSKLIIVNSLYESGKILDGLSGIGAILRY